MNEQTAVTLNEQADLLDATVSDDALEAAALPGAGTALMSGTICGGTMTLPTVNTYRACR